LQPELVVLGRITTYAIHRIPSASNTLLGVRILFSSIHGAMLIKVPAWQHGSEAESGASIVDNPQEYKGVE